VTAKFLTAACAAFAALASLPALAQDAHTTRIEHESYYGAVVTVEQGVRVFRPLPPDRHVIINPDGDSKIRLNVGDAGGSRHSVRGN